MIKWQLAHVIENNRCRAVFHSIFHVNNGYLFETVRSSVLFLIPVHVYSFQLVVENRHFDVISWIFNELAILVIRPKKTKTSVRCFHILSKNNVCTICLRWWEYEKERKSVWGGFDCPGSDLSARQLCCKPFKRVLR